MKRLQAAMLAVSLLVGLVGCAGTPASSAATAESAQATPAPTATPAPVNNPLTGVAGDYTGKRPVAVSLRTGPGATPQWGIARADVLIEGVTEGSTAALTALFAGVEEISKAGPVGPGRDLMLQMALPLNAVPVHIDKNIYASNLLNVLSYQDLDGYHIGTAGFAIDEERHNSGYAEENCWYTTAERIQNGLGNYGASTAGANMPLFYFAQRPAPAARNATSLFITFSDTDTEELVYAPDTGLYCKNNADGTPATDADNGEQAVFTNVFVLYASSGVKDDGITRQYDLAGGTGLYLTGGAWEPINWTKGDATAPLSLTDSSGQTLAVNPGKSFIAIWGGYYGQGLRLLAEDGAEQTLPAKPALLASGISDEAVQAALQAKQAQQALQEAQQAVQQAQDELTAAQQAQADAAATEDTEDDAAAATRVTAAQEALDAAQNALNALQPAAEPEGAAEVQPPAEPESTAESQPPAEPPAAEG